MNVLYEDNHLLVLNKPAGIPTMGAEAGEDSLLLQAKDYLKHKYQKPGNVYLGVVSRIDSLVTGVLIIARTSKAAARLSEQFRQGTPEKTYWALVQPMPPQAAGKCENWVVKDEAHHKMRLARRGEAGAQIAQLNFRVLSRRTTQALLEVELLTGRKHQIRLQLSALGCPVLGDRKYSSPQSFPSGIALHARQLSIEHPISRERMKFVAPVPAAWNSWRDMLPAN